MGGERRREEGMEREREREREMGWVGRGNLDTHTCRGKCSNGNF